MHGNIKFTFREYFISHAFYDYARRRSLIGQELNPNEWAVIVSKKAENNLFVTEILCGFFQQTGYKTSIKHQLNINSGKIDSGRTCFSPFAAETSFNALQYCFVASRFTFSASLADVTNCCFTMEITLLFSRKVHLRRFASQHRLCCFMLKFLRKHSL